MADAPQALRGDDQGQQRRHRSPNYPRIDLETAIGRARVLHEHERRGSVNARVAVRHWGYAERSSGGQLVLGALKGFGLITDTGEGTARTIQLSELALRILLDARPVSPERDEAIKRAALNPRIHADIWTSLHGDLGSDDNLRHRLIFDWRFNENVVDAFIREFRATVAYAKLNKSDTLSDSDGEKTENVGNTVALKIGDYVQWESQGVVQFESRRITGFSPDEQYALVEGSNTGLPVKELTVMENAPDSQTPPLGDMRLPPPGTPGTQFRPPIQGANLLTQTLVVSIPRNFRVDVQVRGDELKKEDLAKIKSQFTRWLEGLEEAFE